MSLTKRAFTRGINDELIRLGFVRYRDKYAADEIADAVGDQMPQEPAAEPVSPETATEVAATLVDAANKLVEETGAAGLAEEGAPPMGEEAELKTSAAQDLDTRAHNQAYACMVKAAQEVEKRAMGSTIEGGDKGNTLSDAGSLTGEGKIEADRRPDSYANVGVAGVGDTSHPAGRDPSAQVGTEEAHPDQPGASDAGAVPPASGNTVVEQSKSGSLRALIQKVAMGTTIEGGDKGNTLDQAASVTGEGALEAAQRPMGYAHMGLDQVGQTETPIGRDPASSVGHEMPHPEQPGESPAGAVPGAAPGNTVVEQSNASKEGAYMELFTQTAQKVASLLPQNLGQDAKIAHIRQMMGLTDSEQTEYIGLLHKEAGATDEQALAATEKAAACMRSHRQRYQGNPGRTNRLKSNQKTAAELTPAQEKLPDALKNAIKAKGDGGNGNGNGEMKGKEEGPKEEPPKPKEDSAEAGKEMPFEKKEGADLLSRIRHISQSVRA